MITQHGEIHLEDYQNEKRLYFLASNWIKVEHEQF